MTFEEINKVIEKYSAQVKKEGIERFIKRACEKAGGYFCTYSVKEVFNNILQETFEETYGKKDRDLFDTHERPEEAECDSIHDKVNCICKEAEKELLEKGICSEVKYQFSVYSCNPTVAFTLKKEGHYYSFNYGIDRLLNEGKDVKGAMKIIINSVVRFFDSMRVDYSRHNAGAVCVACNRALKRLKKVFDSEGTDKVRKERYNIYVACTLREQISFEFWNEHSWGNGKSSGGTAKGVNYLNFEEDNFGDYKVDKWKKITEEDAKLIEDYMVREGIKFGKEHGYEVNEGSEG